jgi:hypothetical protein
LKASRRRNLLTRWDRSGPTKQALPLFKPARRYFKFAIFGRASSSLPGVERNDLGRGVLEQVGDAAAGHRRDDLLAHRRIGDNAVVDRVAAGLLVVGNDLLERNILLLRETLNPPHGRGRDRCVGDVGTG